MKKCDHCGAPNPDNRTVCYSCGESLDTPPTTQVNPNAQPDPNAQAAANTVFDPDAKTVIMPPFTPQVTAPTPSPTQFAGVFKPHWGRVKRKWIAALAAIFAIIAAGGFFHIILQEKQIAITARQIAWIIEKSNFPHDESEQKLDILLMQDWNRVADMKTGNAELAHGLSDAYQLEAQAAQQEAQLAQQDAQPDAQDAQFAQQDAQEAQHDARIASLMQALATEAQQVANADLYDEQSILHTKRWGKLEQDTLQMLKECH